MLSVASVVVFTLSPVFVLKLSLLVFTSVNVTQMDLLVSHINTITQNDFVRLYPLNTYIREMNDYEDGN